MLTARETLAKILAKSQKVTFWNKKNSFRCFFFFLLTVGDVLNLDLDFDTNGPILGLRVNPSPKAQLSARAQIDPRFRSLGSSKSEAMVLLKGS